MTETGYSTNSITIKQGYFNVLVYDEIETGKGKMQESIEFQSHYVYPRIIITRAIYGEFPPSPTTSGNGSGASRGSGGTGGTSASRVGTTSGSGSGTRGGGVSGSGSSRYDEVNSDNTRYIMDVTANIQALTHGEALTIPKGTNLTKLFRNDPSPGRKKQLRISYISRGYRGNLRIREKDDYLVAGLELGYPPQATVNDDDANHRSGTL
eukprot:scaffold135_cov161-Ochromonas_danica.AAC.1